VPRPGRPLAHLPDGGCGAVRSGRQVEQLRLGQEDGVGIEDHDRVFREPTLGVGARVQLVRDRVPRVVRVELVGDEGHAKAL